MPGPSVDGPPPPYFDSAGYLGAYPEAASGVQAGQFKDAWDHYKKVGGGMGLDPTPNDKSNESASIDSSIAAYAFQENIIEINDSSRGLASYYENLVNSPFVSSRAKASVGSLDL